ncbi:glutathione binding-like protein [Sulfuritalea sp.]|uniref:glutathione binding-like protein n=1 Tax=Sulfuritalea sp. TaxID=2480090 RepID=UPI00391DB7A5
MEAVVRGLIGRRLDVIEKRPADRDYLLGEFSVADGYLFTMLGWGRLVNLDVREGRPLLAAYIKRVAARPGVQQALKEEGLLK